MTSNIEGVAPDNVRCDMLVQVSFRQEQRDEDTVPIPVFRAAE